MITVTNGATVTLHWTTLGQGIGLGQPVPAGWQQMDQVPLVIVVGVTGVGKSTTLAGLEAAKLSYVSLPNRRELTDRLLIPAMQVAAGVPVEPVTDRATRFAYTRRYREQHPGGMSHALAQLWVEPLPAGRFWLFDGLRGVDEVSHAAELLPQANFIVLHAPDGIRVQRLLGRADSFDQVAVAAPALGQQALTDLTELGIRDEQGIFTPAEAEQLLRLVQTGEVSAADLRAKIEIVLTERQNYDPYAASAWLTQHAAERSFVVDTTQHWPAQVVDLIKAQLRDWKLI